LAPTVRRSRVGPSATARPGTGTASRLATPTGGGATLRCPPGRAAPRRSATFQRTRGLRAGGRLSAAAAALAGGRRAALALADPSCRRTLLKPTGFSTVALAQATSFVRVDVRHGTVGSSSSAPGRAHPRAPRAGRRVVLVVVGCGPTI